MVQIVRLCPQWDEESPSPSISNGELICKLRNQVDSPEFDGWNFYAEDSNDTEYLGMVLSHYFCKKGTQVLLSGELGAGKSTIARGYIRYVCQDPQLSVPSPSYLLCLSYSQDNAHDKQSAPFTIHHMDPYRLKSSDKMTGLIDFETAFQEDACLIEWPEKMPPSLSSSYKTGLRVHVSGVGIQGKGRFVNIRSLGGNDWIGEKLKEWRIKGEIEEIPSLSLSPLSPLSTVSLSSPPTTFSPPLPKECYVLGIESSCDDTGAAIVRGDGVILSQALASQTGLHEQYGGVKPDVARDAHAAAIEETVDRVLTDSGISPANLSAISVTVGPGLALCLQVGVRKAMSLSAQYQIPLVPVHHMEAHAMVTTLPFSSSPIPSSPTPSSPSSSSLIPSSPTPPLPSSSSPIAEFPALILLVSGGHNLLVLSTQVGQHKILGVPLDDSIGECFDKVARAMGVENVPGGMWVERIGECSQNRERYRNLPVPLANNRHHKDSCNFSFSGLKTACQQILMKEREERQLPPVPPTLNVQRFAARGSNCLLDLLVSKEETLNPAETTAELCSPLTPEQVEKEESYLQACADLCWSFQRVAFNSLCSRTLRALSWIEDDVRTGFGVSVRSLVVAGGVAANKRLRERLGVIEKSHQISVVFPPLSLCADNGVMVAWTGYLRYIRGLFRSPLPSVDMVNESTVETFPRWPLGPSDPRSALPPVVKGKKYAREELRPAFH